MPDLLMAEARESGLPRLDALSNDRAGRLVEAQAEEARVAQAAGGRPLGEAELGHELRLDPRRVAVARCVDERGVLTMQRAQALAEIQQRGVIEAGADLARVAERSVGVE